MSATPADAVVLRQGRYADVPDVVRLFTASFGPDPMTDFIFPSRHKHPRDYYAFVYRRFTRRYWTPGWILHVLADRHDHPVGFTWWQMPQEHASSIDKRGILHALFAPLMRAWLALREYLSPIPTFDPALIANFDRIHDKVEHQVLNTPRRRNAWYLSTLAMRHDYKGVGLGRRLLHHGLDLARGFDAPAWLISLGGVEKFYEANGMVEVARANVEELASWNGGAVMLKE